MVQGLIRHAKWRADLAAEMDRQRKEPFEWGKNDCLIGLAIGVIRALTGEDWSSKVDIKYKTAAGAQRALLKHGYKNLTELLRDHLPEAHPVNADIGDLVIVEVDGYAMQALGVMDFSGIIVLTPNGHGRLPREQAETAFKVG